MHVMDARPSSSGRPTGRAPSHSHPQPQPQQQQGQQYVSPFVLEAQRRARARGQRTVVGARERRQRQQAAQERPPWNEDTHREHGTVPRGDRRRMGGLFGEPPAVEQVREDGPRRVPQALRERRHREREEERRRREERRRQKEAEEEERRRGRGRRRRREELEEDSELPPPPSQRREPRPPQPTGRRLPRYASVQEELVEEGLPRDEPEEQREEEERYMPEYESEYPEVERGAQAGYSAHAERQAEYDAHAERQAEPIPVPEYPRPASHHQHHQHHHHQEAAATTRRSMGTMGHDAGEPGLAPGDTVLYGRPHRFQSSRGHHHQHHHHPHQAQPYVHHASAPSATGQRGPSISTSHSYHHAPRRRRVRMRHRATSPFDETIVRRVLDTIARKQQMQNSPMRPPPIAMTLASPPAPTSTIGRSPAPPTPAPASVTAAPTPASRTPAPTPPPAPSPAPSAVATVPPGTHLPPGTSFVIQLPPHLMQPPQPPPQPQPQFVQAPQPYVSDFARHAVLDRLRTQLETMESRHAKVEQRLLQRAGHVCTPDDPLTLPLNELAAMQERQAAVRGNRSGANDGSDDDSAGEDVDVMMATIRQALGHDRGHAYGQEENIPNARTARRADDEETNGELEEDEIVLFGTAPSTGAKPESRPGEEHEQQPPRKQQHETRTRPVHSIAADVDRPMVQLSQAVELALEDFGRAMHTNRVLKEVGLRKLNLSEADVIDMLADDIYEDMVEELANEIDSLCAETAEDVVDAA